MNFFTGRACFVKPLLGSIALASGSGFFVRWGGLAVFVTARHNLTGRHWLTNDPLREDGRTPDRLSINVPIVENKSSGGRFGFKEVIVDLETNFVPSWKSVERPKGPCDVAVVPMHTEWEAPFLDRWKSAHSIDGIFNIGCLNDGDEHWMDTVRREHRVGSQAFVLGFPFGIAGGAENRPVWRGGNIATEPRYDFDDWPTFLLDFSGRKGMSGSPVIVRSDEGALHFAGIYSARVLGEKHNSELGYVWKCTVIQEALASAYGHI